MTLTSRIAADIGGTFTDIAVVTDDGRLVTRKVPSTPANYADAVVQGIGELMAGLGASPDDLDEVLHGCTVATNAILELEGARTALITTKGFRDVLELRRVRVPRLYDPLYVKPAPLVPRHLRFEVEERLDARGHVVTPLNEADLLLAIERIRRLDVEAVAVCFLHSFLNPEHERRAGALIRHELPRAYVSLSVDVLPQKREYERTSTTVINAYVGPPVKRYLRSMLEELGAAGVRGRLMVMQSSGGILDAASVLDRPAQIVECGPAAGVIGAQQFARMAGYGNLITLDMGGTTAKASIVENGSPILAEEYEVGGGMSSSSALVGGGGYALKLPVIDISEVGAGGGSIAWLDKAGQLKVGPKSAGAVPGPVCYGTGGEQPTVTDANVVLGYLNPTALAGGAVPIDAESAARAIGDQLARRLDRSLLETAWGIHTVANANMMKAVKAVTTYRGRDPRDFALFVFGGSGGVHATDLAEVLQIRKVILPVSAGVFSAVGLLFADLQVNETAAFHHPAEALPFAAAEEIFARLADHAAEVIGGAREQITFRRYADARFSGQAFELTVPLGEVPLGPDAVAAFCRRFEDEHRARYGHAFSGEFAVEIVNLRLIGTRRPARAERIALDRTPAPARASTRKAWFGAGLGLLESPVLTRMALSAVPSEGPMIIEEYEGTAVVPPGWRAARDASGSVVIEPSRTRPGGAS